MAIWTSFRWYMPTLKKNRKPKHHHVYTKCLQVFGVCTTQRAKPYVGNCKIYTPYFCIYPKNINDGDSNDMLDDVIRINNHSELNQLNFPFFGIYISMSNINSDCQMLTHIKIHIWKCILSTKLLENNFICPTLLFDCLLLNWKNLSGTL